MNASFTDIDGYLASIPALDRAVLGDLRRVIRSAAPEAVELISYAIPAFKYRGKGLIYFAASKNHCAIYGTSAGTLRFASSQPLDPEYVVGLITARIAAIDASLAKRRRKPATEADGAK